MKTRSLVALAVVAAGLGGTVRAEIIDRVLAVVGSEVVTLSDVRAAQVFGLVPPGTPADSIADVLAHLVNRELMLSEVDRYSAPEPEKSIVDRRVAQMRSRFATPEQLKQALARTAMTEARLRIAVADNIRIDTYVEQRFGAAAQPTPDEVLGYYREHPADFTRGGERVPFDEAQPLAQQKLTAERTRALIADWLDRLRRRGQVEILYAGPVSGIK